MSKTLDFLSKRRSVTAKMMKPGHVKNEDLNLILNTGLRVPDHGGLKPWKIIVFKGESRKKFDEEVILREFKANNANLTPDMIKMESSRLQRADTVIAIISNTVEHSKIPEWEQILSCGAVCTTILYAAQSLGYAAQWVTEWYAYNTNIISELGGNPLKDKVAGYIYIGEKNKNPKERIRPNFDEYINYY